MCRILKKNYLETHFRAKDYSLIILNRIVNIEVVWQERDGRNGRMGGGWLWKAGIMYSPGVLVLEFFVISIRIAKMKKALDKFIFLEKISRDISTRFKRGW